MRVAIVDDVRKDAQLLRELLRRYQGDNGGEWETALYANAEDFLARYRPEFDLVILDIDMPGLNGVDAARRIREMGDNVVLMFVTNMPQYALQGYAVDAIDYLIKPVSYEEFSLKLKKAQRYARLNQSAQLTLHTADGVALVPSDRLLYVESSLHYLTYHTLDGDYRVRGSLNQAETELPPSLFARCGGSFLVNLRHVKGIEKQDVLVGAEWVKLSRGKRLEFMEKFSRYLGGMAP